jgi:para-aminobenzoate synthetase component I
VVATHSPERFFSLSAEGEAESRPIKGTRPRRPEPEQDARELAALMSSEKDRAENVMIVDLMRNDFSRVCVPGSVRVPELCTPHSYSNVHHLVSRVTGQLNHGCDAFDLLAASFPPGSVTGAPKLRALRIIHELEDGPRGAYCGAIGYVAPDGSADFNVMIRSVSFIRQSADDWKFVFRSGAGITIASDSGEEYAETLDKASTLLQVLG